MKILIFCSSLISGGKERQVVELLKGLAKCKDLDCEVVLFSREIHYREVLDLDVKIHYVIRSGLFDITTYNILHKIFRQVRPDVVHVWDRLTARLVFPLVLLFRPRYVYGSIRGAGVRKYTKIWWIDRINFLIADKIIANSKAGLKVYGGKIKDTKVIYNGFDINRIDGLSDEDEVRKSFEIKTRKVIGMVGSLDGRKDSYIFIEAAKEIIKKRNDVTFIYIGEGPERSVHLLGLEDNEKDYIKLPGRQEHVESIVNIFSIGVLTSKNTCFIEGISNAIMEYMALGKAVVATNGGGTPELLNDKETGFLVAPGDLDGLVARINYLLDNMGQARAMGDTGRSRIRDDFSLEKMVNGYRAIYERVVDH